MVFFHAGISFFIYFYQIAKIIINYIMGLYSDRFRYTTICSPSAIACRALKDSPQSSIFSGSAPGCDAMNLLHFHGNKDVSFKNIHVQRPISPIGICALVAYKVS